MCHIMVLKPRMSHSEWYRWKLSCNYILENLIPIGNWLQQPPWTLWQNAVAKVGHTPATRFSSEYNHIPQIEFCLNSSEKNKLQYFHMSCMFIVPLQKLIIEWCSQFSLYIGFYYFLKQSIHFTFFDKFFLGKRIDKFSWRENLGKGI